jgi:ATP-dependent DNA ligase
MPVTGTVSEAMLYAFDLLELDGEDLRNMPLGDRKKRLATLLGERRIGIVLSEHTNESGALLFVTPAAWASRASSPNG